MTPFERIKLVANFLNTTAEGTDIKTRDKLEDLLATNFLSSSIEDAKQIFELLLLCIGSLECLPDRQIAALEFLMNHSRDDFKKELIQAVKVVLENGDDNIQLAAIAALRNAPYWLRWTFCLGDNLITLQYLAGRGSANVKRAAKAERKAFLQMHNKLRARIDETGGG
jgi:hypothetical protein